MSEVSGSVRVSDLRLRTRGKQPAALVEGVSFDVTPGEALGIVGESGSGKSLTLRSILGLLPDGVERAGGSVDVHGRVGMVFQDPLTALDPLEPVGRQIAAAVRANNDLSRGRSAKRQAKERALELMRAVDLPDPTERYGWYPHQLSGGQRQRVVIAIALAVNPDVLLCDEPTTALDVTVQRQVLALLNSLREERGITILFVSHNLAVVSSICDRVIVMRSGRIVESGSTTQVITAPKSPYTRLLVGSVLGVPELETRSSAASAADRRGSEGGTQA